MATISGRTRGSFGDNTSFPMKPPAIQGLCPLMQVFDMPTSLAFYRDLLGFQVVQQAPRAIDAIGLGSPATAPS